MARVAACRTNPLATAGERIARRAVSGLSALSLAP